MSTGPGRYSYDYNRHINVYYNNTNEAEYIALKADYQRITVYGYIDIEWTSAIIKAVKIIF